MRPFGVYVHFPYCTHRCPYCDFAVTTERPPGGGRYARAVLGELRLRADAFDGLSLASIYLGGGTPSLWDPPEVGEVLAAIRARFAAGAAPALETTLEVNPESCDPDWLRGWRDAGVNRISVGAQSFDPGVLAKLGRRHGAEEAERAIRLAADAVGNVSVDLIHGARRSTPAIAAADAARAVAAGAVHVSDYALTVDAEALAEEVPFVRLARAGRLPLPGEEETLAQGRALRAALRRAGLRRYEIRTTPGPGTSRCTTASTGSARATSGWARERTGAAGARRARCATATSAPRAGGWRRWSRGASPRRRRIPSIRAPSATSGSCWGCGPGTAFRSPGSLWPRVPR